MKVAKIIQSPIATGGVIVKKTIPQPIKPKRSQNKVLQYFASLFKLLFSFNVFCW